MRHALWQESSSLTRPAIDSCLPGSHVRPAPLTENVEKEKASRACVPEASDCQTINRIGTEAVVEDGKKALAWPLCQP